MNWIEPKYSREKVRKAGKALIKSDVNSKKFKEAIPVFHNWRSSHAFPMQIMLDLLRKNAIRIDRRALAVQRLKRVSSIFQKLYREEGMSLSRMEDIAGCRAVVDNSLYVNKLYERLKKSKTKNILHRERNYIENPKESGYRGIHLVFKYNGKKESYRNLAAELQLRSKIQHSWATAVEVVGTFTKQALKASSGEAIWLNFFKYASVEFSKLENTTIDSRYDGIDTLSKLKEYIDKLGLHKRLSAFKVAVGKLSTESGSGAGYYILLLDLEERMLSISRFPKSELSEATKFYDQEEERYRDDDTKDLVLVSATSLKDLKKGYPNYFSDTENFEKYLAKVLEQES